jgi:alpha-glucosidase
MTKNKLWWKDGIIYQIYPRSFQDSNGDGIGDLNGIISRLDYLKDLGVNGLWLSPINPSPDADFGYDVSDYNAIDPKYGTMADFDRLLEEAHKRKIRIIMDLVLNHTSNQHPWFLESQSSESNPYHDWYLWRDPSSTGGVPNNWLSTFGGSGWEYNKQLNKYYFHMFTVEQPDLNWRNPEVRKAMLDVFKFWLERGVDGFRLDVFNAWYKHPDMPDLPRREGFYLRPFDRYEHIYDVSQPEMMDVLRDIRKLLDSYSERYAVGETFLASSAQARTYINEDKLHAGFDYAYARSFWSPRSFGNNIQYWDALHPKDAWPNYFLNNHDTRRTATRYFADRQDAKLKLLAAMHLTVRGTPYLYYGEEIGMRDITLLPTELQDPVGKRYWPFYAGRDGCRSPMQWEDAPYAGFSTVKPWLKVNKDFARRNVAHQAADPASLLNLYKELIALRASTPALYRGEIELINSPNPDLLLYKRKDGKQEYLIVLNFSLLNQVLELSLLGDTVWDMVYAGNSNEKSHLEGSTLNLVSYGFAILSS